jgi:putative intracellular protease/amidase/GNAT superfamily N-acetyltransferase
MHIALLTFDGFNELDAFIALGVLNRVKRPGWHVTLASPTPSVTSMHGVTLQSQATLGDARVADAVVVGSGIRTREIAADAGLMAELRFDPARQLIGAQCSGTLLLAKLGLLGAAQPACTDLGTKPWLREAGIEVLDQPFVAAGNVATAGGSLASVYLAAWLIARSEGTDAAAAALHHVAPVGEKGPFVEHALAVIGSYLPKDAAMTGPEVGFETAAAADADALVALRIEAMRDSLERIGRFDPQRARERFLSAFVPELTRHLVVGAERVGFLVLRPDPTGLLLDHLYVQPRHQGRGIGAAALARVFAEADAQRLPLRVGALRGSDANRFYQRHGFRQVEESEWDIYYQRPAHEPDL